MSKGKFERAVGEETYFTIRNVEQMEVLAKHYLESHKTRPNRYTGSNIVLDLYEVECPPEIDGVSGTKMVFTPKPKNRVKARKEIDELLSKIEEEVGEKPVKIPVKSDKLTIRERLQSRLLEGR